MSSHWIVWQRSQDVPPVSEVEEEITDRLDLPSIAVDVTRETGPKDRVVVRARSVPEDKVGEVLDQIHLDAYPEALND